MKLRIMMTIAMIFVFLAGSAYAAELKIHVRLSPAGAFTAETQSLQLGGRIAKKGSDGFEGKAIAVDLKTLKTGISLRDRHMSEKYFETAKHPRAVLHQIVGRGGRFRGIFEIHGVRKVIEGNYRTEGTEAIADFDTKLSDFKITEPRYMGVGVRDQVKVEVRVPLAEL